MGEHRARPSVSAGRIAGRGAMTAAAALALTGGTASLAFAGEAPHVDHTVGATQHAVQSLAGSAAALPHTEVPTSAAGLEKLVGDHEADVEHKVADIAGPAGQDVQHTLNANGVPVGNHVTDTEHEIVNRTGAVSERVHHATGATAAALDEQSGAVSDELPATDDAPSADDVPSTDDLGHAAGSAQHEVSDTAAGVPGLLSFA